MTRKKEQSKASKIFWRIGISAVGIALILMAVGNLSLFFFGESTTANVTTRRYGGADNGRPISQRYEWSVDYSFSDKEGKPHSGHTNRRGNDLGLKVENTVYYFPFAPFINSLENEAEPNIGQPFLLGIGTLFLFVMNKKKEKTSRSFKVVTTPTGKIDVPSLNDYDDSVEEVFHDNGKV